MNDFESVVAKCDCDCLAGFMEGGDPNAPEPGANHSACYRHGFTVARANAGKAPERPAFVWRMEFSEARVEDMRAMGIL